jgi:DNA-directed RNA polymerase specialized sigma subunit
MLMTSNRFSLVEKTQSEVAEIVGVSKATISRLMAEARRKEQKKMGLL